METSTKELIETLPLKIEHDGSIDGGPFYLSVNQKVEDGQIIYEAWYWGVTGLPPREMQVYAMRDMVKGTMYRTTSGTLNGALSGMIGLLKGEGKL